MKIDEATLRIIPDSRGNETLEAELVSGKLVVSASVPAGKSTGTHEAFVLKPQIALEKLTEIKSEITGRDFSSPEDFDNFLISLDGTPNKSKLGANLILALSISFVKLLAKSENNGVYRLISEIAGVTLNKFPLCFFNLIEGGVHTKNSLPFQEYLLVPEVGSPRESLQLAQSFIGFLGKKIEGEFGKTPMGDEGGFTVPSDDPEKGLEILRAVQNQGHFFNTRLSLDVAASVLYRDGEYQVGDQMMSRTDLLSLYQLLSTNYQLLSVEDPFAETDWTGFNLITQKLGEKVWVVADDLTTTNPQRVEMAAERGAANAMIVKPNQIGSVTETVRAAHLAKSYGWKIIVSHRSGETMDAFIADLAVGLGADGLKAGCPKQEERLVKYQRLAEIERELRF